MKRDAAEILKDALALPTEARGARRIAAGEPWHRGGRERRSRLGVEVNRGVAELDSRAVKAFPGPTCGADSPRW